MMIKLHEKSTSSFHIDFSKTVLLIPHFSQFGFRKERFWKTFKITVHWLFLKIHFNIWSKK